MLDPLLTTGVVGASSAAARAFPNTSASASKLVLVAVRVGGVERCHHLVVVTAGFAIAQELDALYLDLVCGLLLVQDLHDLVDELIKRHRKAAFSLSGE